MAPSPDIVIVGSGMGGATVAAGLAATSASILILERGERIEDVRLFLMSCATGVGISRISC